MRVLLTGMSGTGKSSVIERLAALGYAAVDTDYGWCCEAPDGEVLWREDRIAELLSSNVADVLFVSGCVSNQGKFYERFDRIVLLSAPSDVIVERLATRSNNPFGKQADELARVLDDLALVEPILRAGATDEIVTTRPLEEVVADIVRLVED